MSIDQLTGGNIEPRGLEEEMRSSYLDYAMSVIVGRALPDVRDGLKPVHRRVLYGMSDMGLGPTRPYAKCARIVGEVMGNYHPHGDSAIYDALVRLAQDFSMRFPNLLVNGSSGIAVGMATNIPPHNLREVTDAVVAYIDDPTISVEGLMAYIKGPDFPTGGTILGLQGIRDALPKVVLNKLYKHTPMQTTFGVNTVALVDGVPRTLSLREVISAYVGHQREVVVRRSKHELGVLEA